jgi:hypothetical protein
MKKTPRLTNEIVAQIGNKVDELAGKEAAQEALSGLRELSDQELSGVAGGGSLTAAWTIEIPTWP